MKMPRKVEVLIAAVEQFQLRLSVGPPDAGDFVSLRRWEALAV